MTDRPTDLDPYLAEHVREALAQDPRVGELGVDVEIAGETVVLRGEFSSPEQQAAAAEVARGLLPNHRVRDETSIPDLPEPVEAERLP